MLSIFFFFICTFYILWVSFLSYCHKHNLRYFAKFLLFCSSNLGLYFTWNELLCRCETGLNFSKFQLSHYSPLLVCKTFSLIDCFHKCLDLCFKFYKCLTWSWLELHLIQKFEEASLFFMILALPVYKHSLFM